MRLLTIQQVSDRLQVPAARGYELARRGLLPVVHLGRQLRVDEDALREWIARGGQSLRAHSHCERGGGE